MDGPDAIQSPSPASELHLLLEALIAAGKHGDAEAAWMLKMLRQEMH